MYDKVPFGGRLGPEGNFGELVEALVVAAVAVAAAAGSGAGGGNIEDDVPPKLLGPIIRFLFGGGGKMT